MLEMKLLKVTYSYLKEVPFPLSHVSFKKFFIVICFLFNLFYYYSAYDM